MDSPKIPAALETPNPFLDVGLLSEIGFFVVTFLLISVIVNENRKAIEWAGTTPEGRVVIASKPSHRFRIFF